MANIAATVTRNTATAIPITAPVAIEGWSKAGEVDVEPLGAVELDVMVFADALESRASEPEEGDEATGGKKEE